MLDRSKAFACKIEVKLCSISRNYDKHCGKLFIYMFNIACLVDIINVIHYSKSSCKSNGNRYNDKNMRTISEYKTF